MAEEHVHCVFVVPDCRAERRGRRRDTLSRSACRRRLTAPGRGAAPQRKKPARYVVTLNRSTPRQRAFPSNWNRLRRTGTALDSRADGAVVPASHAAATRTSALGYRRRERSRRPDRLEYPKRARRRLESVISAVCVRPARLGSSVQRRRLRSRSPARRRSRTPEETGSGRAGSASC